MYDNLFEAWKREFHSSELQPLRPAFFKEVASYVRRLRDAQRNLDPKSIKAMILNDELRRLHRLLHQLIDQRLDKIKDVAGGREHPAVELSEKWVLKEFTGISRHVTRFKDDLEQGIEPASFPPSKQDNLMVRFIKDLPAIIGVDLKTHGPFRAEDVASLPFENAESLIRQGAAVEVRPRLQENG